MNLMDNVDDTTEQPAAEAQPASMQQDSAPEADSSTAISNSVGQSRAMLRSMCSYNDPTPKTVGNDRIYCAKTMELLQTAYDDNSSLSTPALTTAAMVQQLCDTATGNALRMSGCCVREIMVR
jgi:hypothetical protein